MKNFKKLGLVLFLATSAILSSCSNDDGGSGGGASAGTIKGKAGGTSFTTIQQGTFAELVSNGTFQNLSIAGANTSGKTIQLMVVGNKIVAGTYTISEQDQDFTAVASYGETDINNPTNSQTWAAPYDGGGNSGQIVITEITATKVKGTFNFTGSDANGGTKSVTDGSFNVNFSEGN